MSVSGRLPVKVVLVDEAGDPADSLEAVAEGIGDSEDEANDPTVIGLLKQIIVALGEVKTAIENSSG